MKEKERRNSMYPSANGKMFFNDLKEMYYNLFIEIGLSINNDNYIYDQDTGIVLKYKDKYMKLSFNNEVYAGRNDIVFDPSTNYNLMVMLFGYYMEKEAANGNDIGYIAQFTEEEFKRTKDQKERYRQRAVVRTRTGDICSNYYYNLYLALIDVIFIISGSLNYDLSNFDILPEV
jgi:hypothetical protein